MFFKINKYIFLYIAKRIFEQIDKRFAWCKDQIKTKSYRYYVYNKRINHFTKNISLKTCNKYTEIVVNTYKQ